MTGAIFGLVGVIVGGLLTGAVASFRDWRSQRALSRAAARLLSAELSVQQAIIEQRAAAADEPVSDDMPTVADWPEQRVVMAKVLDDETWITVAGAYANLVVWHAQSGRVPASRDDMSALATQLETARGALQAFR
jgi:hypothetical protein